MQTSGLFPRLSILGSDPGLGTLAANTLGGKDTVSVGSDVSTLVNPVIDLGADQ